ncbi:N-acyl homoserine lactonase family protein [Sphingobium sp. Sx8-8]|uniref:N-acyl homoserine lactonase family protein n=1 Tax=Sphingobium sp. Sx8-8 TaxID=2933617 RepID=UPI001F5AF44B|nr:N-acyl homoserine lactonase family protein [Sphingobium sp. Sx8-8]
MAGERQGKGRRMVRMMALLAASLGGSSVGTAQTRPAQAMPQPPSRPNIAPLPRVTTPRLYVIDCGYLTTNRPEAFGLTRDEVADSNMPVTCYLVIHPKGVLLYDTGLSDLLVGRPAYEHSVFGWGQIKMRSLRGELADIGLAPEDITYLALSHGHFDHVGNANMFAGSTWLTPRAEYADMFEKGATFSLADYAALAHSRKILYDGDHDVFGDGTVILKATPGHTPGHQSLYVKLAHTGGVILSGDLYHYEEELTKDRMPERERHSGTPESRRALADFAARTHSQLWIGHSTAFFRNARKSPAWYD